MVGELQVPRAAQQFTSDRRQGARAQARSRLHRLVRRAAGPDRQAAARQRRHRSSCELFGVLLADGRRSCPRPRARCSRRNPWTWHAAGMSERVAKEWKAKTGKEPNAYVANYYNAVMVFVHPGAGARRRAASRSPARTCCKQRKANGQLRSRRRQDGRSCRTARSRCRSRSTRSTAAAPASWSRAAPWRSNASPYGLPRAAASALHQRSAARRDLRADCGRLLADLRRDQDLPRRARRGLHDRRLPILVDQYGAGLPWPVARCAAVVAAVVFGLFMERFIYRPIQRHEGSFFTVFIAAFGVQIIVQNLIGTVFGPRLRVGDDAAQPQRRGACPACSSRRSRRSRIVVAIIVLHGADVLSLAHPHRHGHARALGKPRSDPRVRPRSGTRGAIRLRDRLGDRRAGRHLHGHDRRA